MGAPKLNGAARRNGASLRAEPQPLHRLSEVRRQQGISRQALAHRMNVDVSAVKQQESGDSELTLRDLYRWQQALEVPVSELLVEAGEDLATPILRRAQLLRLMKTALAIQETCQSDRVQRMAETLIDQLSEIMPELKEVSAWHSVGRRRSRDEFGVAASRRLSQDVFVDLMD